MVAAGDHAVQDLHHEQWADQDREVRDKAECKQGRQKPEQVREILHGLRRPEGAQITAGNCFHPVHLDRRTSGTLGHQPDRH